jgi:plastocyanin
MENEITDNNTDKNTGNRDNRKFITVGIILGILIILTVAGILGYFVLVKNKADTPPPLPSEANQAAVVPPPPVFSGKSTISLASSGFEPVIINVKKDTLVSWINNSSEEAAIASDPHPAHTAYPPLNLGKFPSGNSISLIFDKAGTYKYHNHFNPSQKGTVIVE